MKKKKEKSIKSILENVGELPEQKSLDLENEIKRAQGMLNLNQYQESKGDLFKVLAKQIALVVNKQATKGLFLAGPNGVGKTFGFETMLKIIKPFVELQPVMINALEVQRNYLDKKVTIGDMAEQQEEVFVQEIYNYKTCYPDLIIDDLGSERTVNDFGNRFEIMADLIMYRYEWGRKHNCLTYFSSNLSPAKIRDRYGERISSRIEEMCEVVFCDGKDWRKEK